WTSSLQRLHSFPPPMNQRQSGKRQHSIQQQHLQSDLVSAEKLFRVHTDDVTDHRRQHANNWHILVFHLKVGEYPKRKQAEKRSVGVCGDTEHGIDDTLATDFTKHHDDDQEKE